MNITVSWRSSAASFAPISGRAADGGAFKLASARSSAMASSSLRRRDNTYAKVLQVLCRQAREDRVVDLVLAECRFILSEAKASQLIAELHGGTRTPPVTMIIQAKQTSPDHCLRMTALGQNAKKETCFEQVRRRPLRGHKTGSANSSKFDPLRTPTETQSSTRC